MMLERLEREKLARARALADELVRRSRGENQDVARELAELLAPPPSMADILLSIPAEWHKDRIEKIGISHQGYYNLLHGVSRPNTRTTARLAKLTGLPEDVIRTAGP